MSQQASRQWAEVGRDELKLPDEAKRLLNDATGGAATGGAATGGAATGGAG